MSGGLREMPPDGSGSSPLRVLLIDRRRTTVGSSLAQLLGAPNLTQVTSLNSAYRVLACEEFDAVLIGLRLSRQERVVVCRRLVHAAGGAPVIVLLDSDQVIDLREGIEAGVAGFYYKVQIGLDVVHRVLQPALRIRTRRSAAA